MLDLKSSTPTLTVTANLTLRFYRTSEKRLKFRQRCVSRKKKGSTNRKKAINRLGRVHLKISRQCEEHAKKLARCVIQSNDLVAYGRFED